MMTATYNQCRKCSFERALWHYSSDNMVNWTACPKCRSFFDDSHQIEALKELTNLDEAFWKNVEQDTGYVKENRLVHHFDNKKYACNGLYFTTRLKSSSNWDEVNCDKCLKTRK